MINDGNPWYLSPDIWVVPGVDPDGAPGTPIAGQPAFVWARVRNEGEGAVWNAKVNYWIADPTAGAITAATAQHIGVSDTTLAPGEVKEVLCVSPWLAGPLSTSHVCAVVEVSHPSDPVLPPRSPTTPFRPKLDRHQAQRNLHVAPVGTQQFFRHEFVIGVGNRHIGSHITARREALERFGDQLRLCGIDHVPDEAGALRMAFHADSGPASKAEAIGEFGEVALSLDLPSGQRERMTLEVAAEHALGPSDGALILIEQLVDDEVIGGLGYLMLGADDRRRLK